MEIAVAVFTASLIAFNSARRAVCMLSNVIVEVETVPSVMIAWGAWPELTVDSRDLSMPLISTINAFISSTSVLDGWAAMPGVSLAAELSWRDSVIWLSIEVGVIGANLDGVAASALFLSNASCLAEISPPKSTRIESTFAHCCNFARSSRHTFFKSAASASTPTTSHTPCSFP